jgi:glycerol 2-dehydrogenase (NADP+)
MAPTDFIHDECIHKIELRLCTGTWQSSPGQVREAVKVALQKGYRHIDTAFAYGNEKEVGQGIKDSGVPREDIWITTKLDNPYHKRVEDGINSSLKNLDVDYVVSCYKMMR